MDQILSDRETMQKVSARQYVQYHDVVPPPLGVDASVVIMEELDLLGLRLMFTTRVRWVRFLR